MQNKNIFTVSQGPIIQMGKATFNYLDTGSPFEKGSGPRVDKYQVIFSKPFQQIPNIHTAFSWLDMDKGRNQRIKTYPLQVTAEGFIVAVETYADTKVYAVEVSWVAAVTN